MLLKRVSLEHLCTLVIVCLASGLLFVGCTLPWQRHHGANAVGPQPTTQQLFTALQKNFRSVSSFHVVMQVQNPGPASPDQISIRTADGDVVMPDKVSAQADIVLSGQAVSVKLISVGANQYVTDPITGQWRVIKGVLDPRTLTDPDTGIISLVNKIQNASQPTGDTVNGTLCWRVTGQLDAKYLKFFTGGGVPSGTMLQTSVCAGKTDALPYEVKVAGQAAAGDTTETARLFEISKYNEQISITAPQI